MKCLDRSLFFEKLDDVLCPKDCSEVRQGCGSDYKLSESILLASGFDASDLVDIFDVLRGQGGFCDCEILYNVAESSRLRPSTGVIRHMVKTVKQGTDRAFLPASSRLGGEL